jgi:prepilin-type processing-associated H-X9-DG protein
VQFRLESEPKESIIAPYSFPEGFYLEEVKMRTLNSVLISLLLAIPCSAEVIIIVDANGTGDNLTIQEGIDAAEDGDIVLVRPGVYEEEVNFLGKAITVQGTDGAAVIDGDGDFAVSFYYGEGPYSVLKNFIIRNSYTGIFIAGSSPTISNITVVNNRYGVKAYAGAEPDIRSSIFWNNVEGDIFQCQARYSCIEDGNESEGNIDADPLFADANNGDYHLLSERGRYLPMYNLWILDEVSSPCVDGGDPMVDPLEERQPNGGMLNMGAYGGTAYASLSDWEMKGDINRDGFVNMIDFSIFAEYWLQTSLRARELDNRMVCTANLKAIGRALLLYANDYDNEFPAPESWCDLLLQYEDGDVTEKVFVCPSAEGGPSHYAINSNAVGLAVSHPDMVLVFDTAGGWNQFGGPDLLAPENHQGDGCNIFFVDNHVEFVETGRFGELRWE